MWPGGHRVQNQALAFTFILNSCVRNRTGAAVGRQLTMSWIHRCIGVSLVDYSVCSQDDAAIYSFCGEGET